MRQNVKVAVGLGSNLSDRMGNLKLAAESIATDLLEGAVSSSVFETPPWGITEQPPFFNAVLVGESDWKPPAILNYLKDLERKMGRVPGPRFGPRLIDLDLLIYGIEEWKSEGLVVPHPGLADREFVLVPLVEVWPDWKHPGLHRTARDLLTVLEKTQPRCAKAVGVPLLDTKTP